MLEQLDRAWHRVKPPICWAGGEADHTISPGLTGGGQGWAQLVWGYDVECVECVWLGWLKELGLTISGSPLQASPPGLGPRTGSPSAPRDWGEGGGASRGPTPIPPLLSLPGVENGNTELMFSEEMLRAANETFPL